MFRVAIVAALEREVRPLVRNWRVVEKEHGGRRFRFFEKDHVVLVCGGIGAEAARRAAEAVIAIYAPALVYSAGFAGALDSALKVGEVVQPRRVVNTGDGSSIDRNQGEGVLVSFASVATPAQKAKLKDSFNAQLVDMEAAGVARAAEARGVEFAVVKAISDEFDFVFPSMEQFVSADGRFHERRFALFAAMRPWLWVKVARLARNTNRASQALCHWLENMMNQTVNSEKPQGLEAVHRR